MYKSLPLYNEVHGITNGIFPQYIIKMYGKEPHITKPRYCEQVLSVL